MRAIKMRAIPSVHKTLALPAVLSLVICLALSGSACQSRKGAKVNSKGSDSVSASKTNASEPTPIEVAFASIHTVSSYLTATSTLEAERTAQLLAETTGKVVAIEKEEGDRIDKGDAIIVLEDTEQRLDFEKTSIDLEVAEKNWERIKELEKRGIVSSKDFDEARLSWEARRHAKARALHELEKTRITAPFAGILTQRNVQLGETVTPGKHVATVADFDPLVARFHVPETEAGLVKVGQPVLIEFPSGSENTASNSARSRTGKPPAGRTVPASTAGSAPMVLPAQVALVSPVIDEGTGTVKLTAYLKNPGYRIKPGKFVRAAVISATHDSALTIPKKALLTEDGTHFAFVAASDTVSRFDVTPGITDGQLVEILSGLSRGQLVVTVGHGGLKAGDRVRITSRR